MGLVVGLVGVGIKASRGRQAQKMSLNLESYPVHISRERRGL